MRLRPFALLLLVAAAAGLLFAGMSTYDFAQHLDRQIHGIHCSFIPGLAAPDMSGTSGCHVTLMSPYSSVLRTRFWGGIPIALPGMGVFAYLLYKGAELLLRRREHDRGSTGLIVLATLVPVLASMVMGWIAYSELGAACKLCIGIYVSSVLCFIGALGLWLAARKGDEDRDVSMVPDDDGDGESGIFTSGDSSGPRAHATSVIEGMVFVALPLLAWVALAPDHSEFVGSCGTLAKSADPKGIMISLDQNDGAIPTIEVFDPLCPACKGFETRLEASGMAGQLDRKAVLFPLDATCNWMVGTSLHPGACAVSEGILCAGDRAGEVIAWAFEQQDDIRARAADAEDGGASIVTDRFPDLASCVGKPAVRTRLNHSLRWAVANQLPVLTPQIYVGGTRMCDEDTDLGMDYALARMLGDHEAHGSTP